MLIDLSLTSPNSTQKCKDAGDPVCTHTMYGETEEELLKNAKEHGIKEHGYSEETWKNEMSHNLEHFRSLIKKS